jgi:phospholipase C
VLEQDVKNGTLPQVSWICAPEAYRHPNWPANYGAWYIEQVLKVLVSNPDVWSKTALFITYDENDGFFDHVPPPFAPQSRDNGLSTVATTNEVFAGDASHMAGAYGLGPRVPMLVVSPWTKGGWVCSQTFDPSLLHHRSALRCAISDHGRERIAVAPRVCGNLTSAFDFSNADAALADAAGHERLRAAERVRHPDYVPVPALQTVPKQEAGLRPARALPYELFVRPRRACERPVPADLREHGPRRRGVPGAVAQPRRRPVDVHGRSRQADRRYVERRRVARPVRPRRVRPERLLLPFPRLVRERRRRHDANPRSSTATTSRTATSRYV